MIKTAVILAAGWGTRLLPATKTVPKEMLPLVDKPIIQYAAEEAIASGLKRIVVVTARGKHSIEDYFDKAPELEALLEKRGDNGILAQVRYPSEMGRVSYVRQQEQLGIGHAISSARDAIGDEPFALFFPDDVIDHPVPVTKQLLDVQHKYGGSVIAVERVSKEMIPSYGIVRVELVEERVYRVTGLVEKPSIQEAPSDLGIVGRYIISRGIFDAIDKTPPGAKGEIQITDALKILLDKEPIYAYEFEGNRYDTGNFFGLLRANIALGLKHPEFGGRLKDFLKGLDL
ncbi:MAG: UTP--glucose-1-phosphate uridylyltransferase GalU [Dehalococcoidia bacterium]|nr:UTP--glucose-1-phosphate uridylyltransferase GalU [Dehalococcoidia bacterium]